MNPLVRCTWHLLAWLAFGLVLHPDMAIVLAALAGTSTAFLYAAATSRGVPFTHGLAWLASAAGLFLTQGFDPITPTRVATFVAILAVLLWTLHTPPRMAPPARAGTTALLWSLVVAATAAVAWWPALEGRHDRLLLHDPLTPAGMALRLLALITAVSILALCFALIRRRRDPVGVEDSS